MRLVERVREDLHVVDPEPGLPHDAPPLGLRVVADVRGISTASASSIASPMWIVSTIRTVLADARHLGVAARTSAKWWAAVRHATTSNEPSANGSDSARQMTPGRMPGRGRT